jgi:hypothetical protein
MKSIGIILVGLICISCIFCIGNAYTVRPTATGTIPTIAVPRYTNITNELGLMQNTTFNGTSPNWSAAIKQVVLGYSDVVGPIALVLIFLLPFSMAFIANRSMKGVAILGILVSTFVFIYLPSNFVAAATICIGISAAGLVYSLFKQGG